MVIRNFATAGWWLVADLGGARRLGEASWNWDGLILLNVALMAYVYRDGWRRLRARPRWRQRLPASHAVAFAASLATILAALISPLDGLSEQLASAHMVQHMLLALVAAPLFVWGGAGLVLACGLDPWWRGWLRVGPWWTAAGWNPVVTGCLFAAVLWGWHHPRMYAAALRDPLVHDAQHLTLFVAAVLFWRVALDPVSRQRLSAPVTVLYLFSTTLHASVLGIFMSLAPRPWYEDYAMSTVAWGWTPLADQQLAGLIMWFPSCLVYPLLAAGCFAAWLSQGVVARDPISASRG